MEVATFADLEREFLRRAHTAVWCNVATVDRQGRPRSRILHPLWVNGVGWILTRRATLKAQHLARNPYVSLAYIADVAHPLYVDCEAAWVDDVSEKRRIWNLFKAAPPPLGYDPAPIFVAPDDAPLGLLRLTPWRAETREPVARRASGAAPRRPVESRPPIG
jgi:uncharacterized pyridoxamine 5'-phosphate oxidase family protein